MRRVAGRTGAPRNRRVGEPCPVDLEAVRAELKNFQRATVDAVVERMFRTEPPQRRFLVADEVGLGKTKVARAVVATTICELWDRPDVDRIDIVYLCSNAQIARQNVRDLDVTGDGTETRLADRITLLPRALRGLRDRHVNLVAFTPGTSLTLGRSTGKVDERALLFALLRRREVWGSQLMARDGALTILQAREGLRPETWARQIEIAEESDLDAVASAFAAQLSPSLHEQFRNLVDHRQRHSSTEMRRRGGAIVVELRRALARACIALLSPDLVILDEFQRFPELLDADAEDDGAELARALFAHPGVRVLMLSATPYRPYTRQAQDDGEHFADFARTTKFLTEGGPADGSMSRLTEHLDAVRIGLDQGRSVDELVGHQREVQRLLRQVMVRTERLAASDDRNGMLRLDASPGQPTLTPDDVRSFCRVDAVARHLGAPNVVEYWKSAPHLLEFMDGYALDRLVVERSEVDPELRSLLADTDRGLDAARVAEYRPVESDNGRLRWFLDDLRRHRAFDLAWLPPALPETSPRGVYASEEAQTFTKRLVFSGWTVVPRALASLVSYEAERHAPSSSRWDGRAGSYGLSMRRVEGRPVSWPVLAMMWPGDGLANHGNPILHAKRHGLSLPLGITDLRRWVHADIAEALRDVLALAAGGREDFRWYAIAARELDRQGETLTSRLRRPWARSGDDPQGFGALDEHVEELLLTSAADLGRPPADLLDVLAEIAIAGPGPVARRGINRVASRFGWRSSVGAKVTAAARVAWALRSLLIGPEVSSLIVRGADPALPFWRHVLQYCMDGAFGSVVQEYLHLVPDQQRLTRLSTEDALATMAEAVEEAVRTPATSLSVRDWRSSPQESFQLRQHFAVRFGQAAGREEHPTRTRAAFNSPFRPFVLVSTSVGQEGLDFHHYSHAVVHWNLPSNPVDLEQREGRVHRYKNHAVRKNVGATYRDTRAMNGRPDPWDAVFYAAVADRPGSADDIVPWWVCQGDAQIERLVPLLPMSRDVGRLRQLTDGARRYRMAFGQPRQSELLASLAERYPPDELDDLAQRLAIDLSPSATPRCPSCHSDNAAKIVYGLVDFDFVQQNPGVVIGGCIVWPGRPDRRCGSCGTYFRADGVLVGGSWSYLDGLDDEDEGHSNE